MIEPMPIDLERLEKITRGDKQLQTELLEIFLQDAPDYIQGIKEAFLLEDYLTLAQKAHGLKGAAATVAVFPLSVMAAQLEAQGKAKQMEEVTSTLAKMEIILAQIQAFLRAKN